MHLGNQITMPFILRTIFGTGGGQIKEPKMPSGSLGQRSKKKVSRKVFIGKSVRFTPVSFHILLVLAILFFTMYVVLYLRYWDVICGLNLHYDFCAMLIVCVLHGLTSLMGVKFLKETVVTSWKLILLHGSMLLSIGIHIFLPLHSFIPDASYLKSDKSSFRNRYWHCSSQTEDQLCLQINTVGKAIWSTLILFCIMLIPWRLSISTPPFPVQPIDDPNIPLRDDLSEADSKPLTRKELNKIYQEWETQNHLAKPYKPHYVPGTEDLNHNTLKDSEIKDADENDNINLHYVRLVIKADMEKNEENSQQCLSIESADFIRQIP